MNAQPPSKPSKPSELASGTTPSKAPGKTAPFESRRHLALVMSVLLLVAGLWLKFREGDSSLAFASASMLRIGLVIGMLWLAWPSLRRPTQWLAPGMAMIIVLTLVIIAANPRLALVAVPAAGTLISIGAVIRMFRSPK